MREGSEVRPPRTALPTRCWDLLVLMATVAGVLLASSAALVRSILTPSHTFRSAVLELDLRCRTNVEIGVFAALVGTSPTEVTLAVGTGPARVFVYVLDSPDAEELAQQFRRLETQLLRVTRGRRALEEVSG